MFGKARQNMSRTHAHTHARTHAHTHTHTHAHTHSHARTHTHTHAFTSTKEAKDKTYRSFLISTKIEDLNLKVRSKDVKKGRLLGHFHLYIFMIFDRIKNWPVVGALPALLQ